MLNTPSPERNWALLSGQMLAFLHATDGKREIVRPLECEQMSRGHHTTVSLNFCTPLVFWLCHPSRPFSAGKLSLSSCMFLPSTSLICLKLYDDEKSSIRFFFWVSLFIPLQGFSFCSSLFFSLPRHPSLSDFLDLFVLFSASHPLPPSLSSLCGRVVINPYFIAGEFLSPCRADSSPRSKTLLGPNPILPPSITPSLPPSGPDY